MFEKNGKRIRTHTFIYRLKVLYQKVRIVEKSFNKIRKTYGTILIDSGVDKSLKERRRLKWKRKRDLTMQGIEMSKLRR